MRRERERKKKMLTANLFRRDGVEEGDFHSDFLARAGRHVVGRLMSAPRNLFAQMAHVLTVLM